jgi:hypothetical protein
MPNTNGHGSGEATERVGLCLRVSSEEQRDRETIEIQRDFLTEYCRLYGLEVAECMPTTAFPARSPCTNGRRAGGSSRMPEAACSPLSWSTVWTGWEGPC